MKKVVWLCASLLIGLSGVQAAQTGYVSFEEERLSLFRKMTNKVQKLEQLSNEDINMLARNEYNPVKSKAAKALQEAAVAMAEAKPSHFNARYNAVVLTYDISTPDEQGIIVGSVKAQEAYDILQTKVLPLATREGQQYAVYSEQIRFLNYKIFGNAADSSADTNSNISIYKKNPKDALKLYDLYAVKWAIKPTIADAGMCRDISDAFAQSKNKSTQEKWLKRKGFWATEVAYRSDVEAREAVLKNQKARAQRVTMLREFREAVVAVVCNENYGKAAKFVQRYPEFARDYYQKYPIIGKHLLDAYESLNKSKAQELRQILQK